MTRAARLARWGRRFDAAMDALRWLLMAATVACLIVSAYGWPVPITFH